MAQLFATEITLESVHGDTDQAAKQAWQDKQDEALKVHPADRKPVECDVLTIWKAPDGKAEIRIRDWALAARLTTGMTQLLTLADPSPPAAEAASHEPAAAPAAEPPAASAAA